MTYYIGIDLGTTNSAISLYDGLATRILKSPQQQDITPSALYYDRRGNRLAGTPAYDIAARSPGHSAMFFKRLMGTNTPIELADIGRKMTPQACSAEILKVLFAYLPSGIDESEIAGTVITVPASFNQMQKDATLEAARMAGLGRVALMQEPVAAVMSVMKGRKRDGVFLVFDLGGGTLDIAIAESMGSRVSLIGHGGIAMCGGRDMDRAVVDAMVIPWLMKHFKLPENLTHNRHYTKLVRMLPRSVERAKINLSFREDTVIALSESEIGVADLAGNDIYLDIAMTRTQLNNLISPLVDDMVEEAKRTVFGAGMSLDDLTDIVFIGGPTNYAPLRERVAGELNLEASTDINPMTAVAEGASIFAESIDWSREDRARKRNRGTVTLGNHEEVSFSYVARTPEKKARIVAFIHDAASDAATFEVENLDSGWTSGRLALKNAAGTSVSLGLWGDNHFCVRVFDATGAMAMESSKLVITRTAASIDAIPASHSLGVEVHERVGKKTSLVYLVRAGDPLPCRGHRVFRAREALMAGSAQSLNFKIWEGEIETPIADNRLIGCLKITGLDFEEGEIAAGAELVCDYEVLDSGNILMEISVPSIGGTFNGGRNFYSRQEGQIDYTASNTRIRSEAAATVDRLNDLERKFASSHYQKVRGKLNEALALPLDETDAEVAAAAMEKVLCARRMIGDIRSENLSAIRQIELDGCVAFFNAKIRDFAKPAEGIAFDNQVRTAQRSIDRNERDFEDQLADMRSRMIQILFARSDDFVVSLFQQKARAPFNFTDHGRFASLVSIGQTCLERHDFKNLRDVISALCTIEIASCTERDLAATVNIFRG